MVVSMNEAEIEAYLAELGATRAQTTRHRSIQTLAQAYAAICAGIDPWLALNEFLHEWLDYSRNQREVLIVDPLRPPAAGWAETPLTLWRWAIFCVGAAEYLCARYGVRLPTWATDPTFYLAEPWYDFSESTEIQPTPHLTDDRRAYLERTTPEPLRRHNVYCGDRVFANKYELVYTRRS